MCTVIVTLLTVHLIAKRCKDEYLPPAHIISDEATKVTVDEYNETGYINSSTYILDERFLSKFKKLISKKK